jgi:hypothetical protein
VNNNFFCFWKAQKQVDATLLGHWNGQTLIESTNRPLDGATLAALNDGMDCFFVWFFWSLMDAGVADDQPTPFSPTSEYVAGTVKTLVEAFCTEYPINNQDTVNGGLLVDSYLFHVFVDVLESAGNFDWALSRRSLRRRKSVDFVDKSFSLVVLSRRFIHR